MGVPAFFRWLSRKYVSIIVDAVEERRREAENGVKVPVDCTLPNQNFQEFDNLYLDMNGIIHPCTHPEDRPAPKTEEEMFILIFEYIDRLFSIVRPRKVLYMAIDGVAPRAKMNQQRSRRFRSAKEATEKREQIENIRKKLESEGVPLPPPRKEEEHFDSNCITPGTPFMARLATALRYYIHKRITYDPAWMNIQVILSDANVPGEGEHKIMDYIRRQRASPSHDPNTVHCLCGADADLIMLGLATHESNFNIIREEFVPNQPRACELCGQYGHELEHCQGLARAEAAPEQADPLKKEKNFIFIRLPVLREYLERELVMPNLPFPFDLERAIDDWVMMCFFVGNDFLPHLPSLEIRENAIDRLIKLYKNMVYQTGGWLTEDGEVNVDRVRIIMVELGKVEDEIFKERQLRELRFKDSQKQRKKRAKEVAQMLMPHNTKYLTPRALGDQRLNLSGEQIRKAAADDRQQMQQQAQKLKSLLTPAVATATESKSTTSIGSKRKATDPVQTADDNPTGAPPAKSFKDGRNKPEESKSEEEQQQVTSKPTIMSIMPSGQKVPLARGAVGALMGNNDESEEEPEDEIRLWEAGWKDRYYNAKFKVSESDKEFRRKVACAYVEGLSWVLRYYYQGCASWTWFFPYHYAPFASDFDLIGDFKPDFSKPTRPFRPLEQLMGVFPAASRAHIPESWRWLMTDEKSPIIDLYPEDFEIDLNGKKYAWQGVALLPFVDEKRLLSSLDTVYDQLTPEEIARNATGPDRLFIGKRHELFELVQQVHEQGKQGRDGDGEREKGGVEEMNDREEKADEEVMEGNAKESKENENGTAEKNGNDTTEEEGDESNGDHVVNGLLKKEMEKHWVLIDASKAFGMAGEVSHDVNALEFGQTHESIFRNSLEFSDIKNNSCLMVEFRDPQFPTNFCFKAQRLSGINELPRVLKPRDYDERRQGPYRPQIGFSRNVPRASLSFTGHRTLGHHIVDQQQQYQPNDRRSGPASLMSLQTSSTFQYQAPPQQPLPWHKSNQQPLQQQPLQMPPPLLNFQQMALPPPPMPPQSWLQPQGGYVGQWGQPPPFVAAPPQRDNSSSWRGGSQPWSQQQGANSSSQQPLPYHRRSLDQQQQQAGPSPQQYGGGANNRGNPRSNHGDRDNHANSQGGQQQNQQQPPRPYASQSRTGPKEFTPSYHQHY